MSEWWSVRQERREKIMAKGQVRFVLIRGVLGWGVPMAIANALFINPATKRALDTGDWGTLSGHVFGWLVAGAAFGMILWRTFESQYRIEKGWEDTLSEFTCRNWNSSQKPESKPQSL
jgi:hypothetical protein